MHLDPAPSQEMLGAMMRNLHASRIAVQVGYERYPSLFEGES